jgi:hypothetical protein
MYIFIPKLKQESEQFDFLTNVHDKLVDHFKPEIESLMPLHLKVLNAYLGRVFHLSKGETKVILNQLAEKNLVDIKKGSGIANYFIIIKRGEAK